MTKRVLLGYRSSVEGHERFDEQTCFFTRRAAEQVDIQDAHAPERAAPDHHVA